MPDERMIQTKSARIILDWASDIPGNENFMYKLYVPKLLSQEQMALILAMVRQMKQGRCNSDGVEMTWFDEME